MRLPEVKKCIGRLLCSSRRQRALMFVDILASPSTVRSDSVRRSRNPTAQRWNTVQEGAGVTKRPDEAKELIGTGTGPLSAAVQRGLERLVRNSAGEGLNGSSDEIRRG
jgi:hypothetical protein